MNELMFPRYKVINIYPDMDRVKLAYGVIIVLDKRDGDQWYDGGIYSNRYDAFYDAYPHLFKKLLWYEDRKIQEMPKYLKNPTNLGMVREVEEYWDDNSYVKFVGGRVRKTKLFVPATEQEFNYYTIKRSSRS